MADDLTQLIEEHFVRTWTMIGTGAGGTLVCNDDFQLTLAAIDHIPYNHVQRCTPTRDVEDVIDDVLRVIGDHDAIWSVTPSSAPPDLAARLEARGSERYSLLSGMAMDLAGALPAPRRTDVVVEEVTPGRLPVWVDLVLDQWHLPPDDRAVLLDMHREFGFRDVRRWLGLLDGAPVARVSVAVHEPGCAGIYGMGTRPEVRGGGLASTLLCAVLGQLRDSGIETVVLQSTPMAVELYRQVGFEEHCRFPVFTVPHAQAPTERMSRT